MFRTLRATVAVVKFPFVVLWKGYSALWWAFAEAPPQISAPAGNQPAHDNGTSFEIVDSTPRPGPPPIKHLRKGFSLTLAVSAVTAVATIAAQSGGLITPQHAFFLWAWSSAAACVASLYKVRSWARKDPAQSLTWRSALLQLPADSFRAAQRAGGAIKNAATSPRAKAAAGHAKAACAWSGRTSWSLARKIPSLFRARTQRPTTA